MRAGRVALFALAGSLFLPLPAQAQTFTWSGGGADGNWSNTGNWAGGAAPTSNANQELVFNPGGAATTTNDIAANFNVNRITLGAGFGQTLSGQSLQLTGSDPRVLMNSSSAVTVANDITFQDTNGGGSFRGLFFDGSGSGNLTLSGNLLTNGLGAGQDNVRYQNTLNSAGFTHVTVTGTNTYVGSTEIFANTILTVGSDFGLGAAAGGTTVSSGGTLQLVGGITLQELALTLNGTGAGGAGALENVSGNNTVLGNIVLGAGTRINSDAGLLTLQGSITGAGQSVTFGGAGNTLVSGAIQTGAGALAKDGAGVLTLSGANTFTGGTTITQGTLMLGAGGSLAATGAVDLAGASAVFDIGASGANQTIGALSGVAGSSVSLGANTLTFGDATNQTFAGTITGTGGIVKEGTGATTLTGANTYTGGTTLNAGGLVVGNNTALGTGTLTVGGLSTLDSSTTTTLANNIVLNAGLTVQGSNDLTLNGSIAGTGALTKEGSATLTLNGNNTFTGGTTINSGIMSVSSGASIGALNGFLNIDGGTLQITGTTFHSLTQNLNWGAGGGGFDIADATNTFEVSQIISGTGGLTKTGAGTLILSGANTYGGGTTIKSGAISVASEANLGAVSGPLTIDGGTLQVTGTAFNALDPSRTLNWGANGGGFDIADVNNTFTVSQIISGTGGLTKSGDGALVLSGANTYAGGTTVAAGTLQAGAANVFASASAHDVASGATLDLNGFDQAIGSLAGAGAVTLGGATLTAGGDNTSTQFSGVISGNGGLIKDGAGTMTLSGLNTYGGATVVNGGTLNVNNDLTSSSGFTVNAGGALGGTGIVSSTVIDGGKLAPGSSNGQLTINGNLSFTAASSYMVEVSPSNAARTNVTGTATLNDAKVVTNFAGGGGYVEKRYTILTANTIAGAFNGSVDNNGLPAGFKTSLSYDSGLTEAYLDLALNILPPSQNGANGNQANVANAVTNYFNTHTSMPMAFGALTPNGLTQVSGELGTGAQQTTYQAMNLFMGLMTDPFSAGRGVAHNGPTAFADDSESMAYAGRARAKNPRDAFAAFTKAPPAAFAQRWNVWAAGYGGSQTTDGNAAAGSNNTTSSVYGAAAGADYWFSPDTVAGFALAGGGSNFSVANGGSGRSDLFQAGAFVRHNFDATYLTAAVAYGWQDVTTDRYVSVAGVDHLRANFNANTYSGRLELGHRFLTPWFGGLGVSPYAAAQITAFELPSYAERAISGAGTFALNYGGDTTTSSRTELGLRTDKSYALDGAVLTLRGRAAWAHDFNPDRAVTATFQTLPGASFVVNGAALASDSALTTASAEVRWLNGWSVAGTFEGEFSNVTRSYAGKGVVRYNW